VSARFSTYVVVLHVMLGCYFDNSELSCSLIMNSGSFLLFRYTLTKFNILFSISQIALRISIFSGLS
jgi:hypothetical protein